jgi:hypothetical protein
MINQSQQNQNKQQQLSLEAFNNILFNQVQNFNQ